MNVYEEMNMVKVVNKNFLLLLLLCRLVEKLNGKVGDMEFGIGNVFVENMLVLKWSVVVDLWCSICFYLMLKMYNSCYGLSFYLCFVDDSSIF